MPMPTCRQLLHMSQTPKSPLLLETPCTQVEEFAEHWAEEPSRSLPRAHWRYWLGPHRLCRWDVLAACRYGQVSLMLTLTKSLELSHCLEFFFFFFSGRVYSFHWNFLNSYFFFSFSILTCRHMQRHTGTSSSITSVWIQEECLGNTAAFIFAGGITVCF